MRTILFAGKGGTGKTSMAAAAGALAAHGGLRTLVMSLDPAHSLCDAFDIDKGLSDFQGEPIEVAENLFVQELNINIEITRHWSEVHDYLAALFSTAGLDEVVAEEIAILPGMEEISALLYVNRYVREKAYDALILDCAPTAESMRFVSMPTALEWYMAKVFRMERALFRVARPIAKRITDMPLPEDAYFESIEQLAAMLEGVNNILTDPEITTVRLVCSPEKMVLRETQRAFMYFCLHGLAVEAVIMNRIWPEGDTGCLSGWQTLQREYMALAESYFTPMPILQVPMKDHEILGHGCLLALGQEVYGDGDPMAKLYGESPIRFERHAGGTAVRLHLPFVDKKDLEVHKVGSELVVRAGVFRKHVALPHAFAVSEPGQARFDGEYLNIEFVQEVHP